MQAAGAAAGLLLTGVVAFLAWQAAPALGDPAGLVLGPTWSPTSGRFGLGPMLAGSALVTLGAVAFAGPTGLAAAVFARFYAPPWLAMAYGRVVLVAAALPSVVLGLWGLTALVPWLARARPPGTSLLAGALVLGLMIFPTVAVLADAALGAVPPDLQRAAEALGLSRRRLLTRVVIPAAWPGLRAAVLLAAARAAGETMAVLMVSGNVVQVPAGLFDPVRVLTANIALEMAYAMGSHRAALFASGLALTAGVAGLVLLAEGDPGQEAHGA